MVHAYNLSKVIENILALYTILITVMLARRFATLDILSEGRTNHM
jgi:hypothetical protein